MEDRALLYQLEKVDQGGEVSDKVEERLAYLAPHFNLKMCEDEENPHYGDYQLPDGRWVVWDLKFEIVSEKDETTSERSS